MKSTTHATIISGGSAQQRTQSITETLTLWKTASYDVVTAETALPSIGIAEIRNFCAALQLSPRGSEYSVGVIYTGELLTVAAQQALLKTLEEPPGRSRIIIAVSTSSLLLPTILSRCQIIELDSAVPYTKDELVDCAKQLSDIGTVSHGARLSWIAGIGKTKEELTEFMIRAIFALRQKNLSSAGVSREENLAQIKLLHDLLEANRYSGTNVNMSLVLERIILTHSRRNIV